MELYTNVFPIFSKNVAFFEKIVRWKNIQNLISNKKKLYSFSLPDGPSEAVFYHFLKKYRFLKKIGK